MQQNKKMGVKNCYQRQKHPRISLRGTKQSVAGNVRVPDDIKDFITISFIIQIASFFVPRNDVFSAS